MKKAIFIYDNGQEIQYECEGITSINVVANDARNNMPEGAKTFKIVLGRSTSANIE